MHRFSGFQDERQLLYHCRMQHIVGHAEPKNAGLRIKGIPEEEPLSPKKAEAPIWSLEPPSFRNPRKTTLAAARQRRPSSAPARGRRGPAPLVYGARETRVRRPTFRDVVDARSPQRSAMERRFFQGITHAETRVDARLGFLKVKADKERALAEKLKASQQRRRERLRTRTQPIAGCWFWVDENTGIASAAPPPEDGDDQSSKGLAHVWNERQRADRRALQRVNRFLDTDDTCVSSNVSDDESVGTHERMGTGNRAYEPQQFNELVAILESERAKRPASAPAALRRQRRTEKQRRPAEGPAPAPTRRTVTRATGRRPRGTKKGGRY